METRPNNRKLEAKKSRSTGRSIVLTAVLAATALAANPAHSVDSKLLWVCKERANSLVSGDFTFSVTINGMPVGTLPVPTGGCNLWLLSPVSTGGTSPSAVAALVEEHHRPGYSVTGIRTDPAPQLSASNLAARTAVVSVPPGTTTVYFKNSRLVAGNPSRPGGVVSGTPGSVIDGTDAEGGEAGGPGSAPGLAASPGGQPSNPIIERTVSAPSVGIGATDAPGPESGSLQLGGSIS